MVNWLSVNCVPVPLNTRVWSRLGVSTIIPGVLPAAIGATAPRTSVAALRTNTPADPLPEPTALVTKARYLRPLPPPLLEGVVAPQLSRIRLAGSTENNRIRALFKPGTPTLCRIITWMQELRIIAKEEVVVSWWRAGRPRLTAIRLDGRGRPSLHKSFRRKTALAIPF